MRYKTKCKKCKKIFEADRLCRIKCDDCKYSAQKAQAKQKQCQQCQSSFTTTQDHRFCSSECLKEHEIEQKRLSWIQSKKASEKELRERSMRFNQPLPHL